MHWCYSMLQGVPPASETADSTIATAPRWSITWGHGSGARRPAPGTATQLARLHPSSDSEAVDPDAMFYALMSDRMRMRLMLERL